MLCGVCGTNLLCKLWWGKRQLVCEDLCCQHSPRVAVNLRSVLLQAGDGVWGEVGRVASVVRRIVFDNAAHASDSIVRDLGSWQTVGNNEDVVAAQVSVDDSVSVDEDEGKGDVVEEANLVVVGQAIVRLIQKHCEVVLAQFHDQNG